MGVSAILKLGCGGGFSKGDTKLQKSEGGLVQYRLKQARQPLASA
jgi:hypothetical protein